MVFFCYFVYFHVMRKIFLVSRVLVRIFISISCLQSIKKSAVQPENVNHHIWNEKRFFRSTSIDGIFLNQIFIKIFMIHYVLTADKCFLAYVLWHYMSFNNSSVPRNFHTSSNRYESIFQSNSFFLVRIHIDSHFTLAWMLNYWVFLRY